MAKHFNINEIQQLIEATIDLSTYVIIYNGTSINNGTKYRVELTNNMPHGYLLTVFIISMNQNMDEQLICVCQGDVNDHYLNHLNWCLAALHNL
jgi:hypothetical protein